MSTSALRRADAIDGDLLCWEWISGEVVVEFTTDEMIDLRDWASRR